MAWSDSGQAVVSGLGRYAEEARSGGLIAGPLQRRSVPPGRVGEGRTASERGVCRGPASCSHGTVHPHLVGGRQATVR
jgi:hypothetical protein